MPYTSTGLRNSILPYVRAFFNRNCAIAKFYSGTIPASADAAETGTLILTLTGAGATVKAKQKIRFTPVTAGTTGTWTIVLNGIAFTFTDDASPTVAEVCTGLYRLINTGQGAAAKYFTTATDGVITAGGRITIPDIYQLLALTDNTTSLDIEAATAGIGFDYSSTATGAGNSITETIVTADAYGLKFEADADISSGALEKLASQVWEGDIATTGQASHWRLVLDSDTGVLSTTEKRVQGLIGTANSDIDISSGLNFVAGNTRRLNTFNVNIAASA